MDDPGWSWPAWKFGMKRGDLFTTLHDQYNTIPSSIQDPEAFHHDVYELSTEATTAEEFHHLMNDRKAQRLRELEESLESASFEIIANPSLIGTTQWEYAIQLFRTRSLDSLVRYFASYLPADHPWHRDVDHAVEDNDGDVEDMLKQKPETQQPQPQSSYLQQQSQQPKPFFEDRSITHEPLSITTTQSTFCDHHDLPPSPRSLTTYSDDSDASNLTNARTLSFSDSEPDHDDHHHLNDSPPPLYCSSLIAPYHTDDDASPVSSAPETPESSISDPAERDVDVKIAVKEEDSDFKDEFVAVELEHAETTEVCVPSRTTEPILPTPTKALSTPSTATTTNPNTPASAATTPTPRVPCVLSLGCYDTKQSPLSPVRTRSLSSSEQQHPWPSVTTAVESNNVHRVDCRRSEDHEDDLPSSQSIQTAVATKTRLTVPNQCTRRKRFWRSSPNSPNSHELLERGTPRRVQKSTAPLSSRSIWTRQRTRRGDGNSSGEEN